MTMEGQLEIRDLRTGQILKVPVHEGNYVDASELSKIGCQGRPGSASAVTSSLRILDRGFQHTACMQSAITHIDGNVGAITFRGQPIQDLFHDHDFEQVMHLLIWGHLPTQEKLLQLRQIMAESMNPPQLVIDAIKSYPRDAPVYSMLLAGLTAFTASDATLRDSQSSLRPIFHGNMAKTDETIIRIYSYYATTVALVHCHRKGREIQKPDPELSFIGNLLRMMGESEPALLALFDKLWILYADHEMTASTAAMLHTGATLADPLSALIAGLTAAYGPLHAGAIHLAYEQLKQIGSTDNIPAFLATVRAKKTRLFGYGHRIYKARDPRLGLVEELIGKYEHHIKDNLLMSIARQLEAQADVDEYFVRRNLRANADLKGCFLYTAFGFDTEMAIAIMGLSRVSGALAHWRESQGQPVKLWRPQQIYTGPTLKSGSVTIIDDVYPSYRSKYVAGLLYGLRKYVLLAPFDLTNFMLRAKSAVSAVY